MLHDFGTQPTAQDAQRVYYGLVGREPRGWGARWDGERRVGVSPAPFAVFWKESRWHEPVQAWARRAKSLSAGIARHQKRIEDLLDKMLPLMQERGVGSRLALADGAVFELNRREGPVSFYFEGPQEYTEDPLVQLAESELRGCAVALARSWDRQRIYYETKDKVMRALGVSLETAYRAQGKHIHAFESREEHFLHDFGGLVVLGTFRGGYLHEVREINPITLNDLFPPAP